MVSKTLSGLDRVYCNIVNSLASLSGILVIFLMLIIFVDVSLRYITGNTISWAFEASEYSLLYITFLGTAWLLKKDGHVRLDVLLTKLKPGAQCYLNLIAGVLTIIACFLLLWYGVDSTWDNYQRHVTSVKFYTLPKAAFLVIIPVGSFLLLIESIKKTCSCVQQIRKGGK